MPWFSHFEGTIHLFQKKPLSVQKLTPYALKALKSLSFAYIILIFSPQITVLQPPTVCIDLCTPITSRGT